MTVLKHTGFYYCKDLGLLRWNCSLISGLMGNILKQEFDNMPLNCRKYRIWQNFRVGKLSQLECKTAIHGKTFAVTCLWTLAHVHLYHVFFLNGRQPVHYGKRSMFMCVLTTRIEQLISAF